MNLYLVLALALGVTAPMPSPRLNTVVAEARVKSSCTVSFAVRSSQFAVKHPNREPRTANCELIDAPLTGGSSPRAPALGC